MRDLSVSVLRLPGFRRLLFTRMCVALAMQSQAIIVGWQVYSLTKSPFLLGLTGLVEAVPAILAALFAGYLVDNGRPQRVYVACVGVLALNALMLLIVAGGRVDVAQGHLLAVIFSGVFISGVARSFVMPASFALTPMIVSRREIPAALPWFNGGFQVAAISGPAFAGLIYGGYGPGVAWMIPAFCAGFAFFLACSIRVSSVAVKAAARENFIASVKAGWKFILESKVLLSVMMLDMLAVLFGGAVSMLPAIADQVLHVGSEGLGILRASPALGAVTVSVLLALFPVQKPSGALLLWVVAGFGFCMVGFGLSTVFWVSMLFLALSGVFDSISVVVRGSMMQLLTPDRMRGRVSSVGSMFIISSNEIGAFESGTAASLLGLVPSIIFGGAVTLLVAGVTAVFVPSLRRAVVHSDRENVA